MKKGEIGEARAYVKELAVRLGEFTRAGLLAEVRGMAPEYAAQAFDSMVKRDPEVRLFRRDSKRLPNKQRVWTRVYRYTPTKEQKEWPKSLHEVGAARAILQRSQTAAKGAVEDYPPGHFTALARAPSDELPHGFPPHFPWDAKMRFYTPIAPIAQLQATLGRDLLRRAA